MLTADVAKDDTVPVRMSEHKKQKLKKVCWYVGGRVVFVWACLMSLVGVVVCHLNSILQAARERTAGDAWFNLPATPITPELHNDLKVLRMRGAIDPQRHYKKADSKELPKYFQVPNENLISSSLHPHP